MGNLNSLCKFHSKLDIKIRNLQITYSVKRCCNNNEHATSRFCIRKAGTILHAINIRRDGRKRDRRARGRKVEKQRKKNLPVYRCICLFLIPNNQVQLVPRERWFHVAWQLSNSACHCFRICHCHCNDKVGSRVRPRSYNRKNVVGIHAGCRARLICPVLMARFAPGDFTPARRGLIRDDDDDDVASSSSQDHSCAISF